MCVGEISQIDYCIKAHRMFFEIARHLFNLVSELHYKRVGVKTEVNSFRVVEYV